MNALVIFAKYPEPGKVKKKLGEKIGMDNSAKLCLSIIKDLITEHEERDYDLYLSFIGKEYKEKYREIFPNAIMYVQRGKNLGENMYHSFEDLLDDYEKVIVIGGDVPDLKTDYVQNAIAALDTYDVVVGPVTDGGYCLIALKKAYEIFADMPWGSEELYDEQSKKIAKKGLTLFKLAKLQDVDDLDEFLALKKRLKKEDAEETFETISNMKI